MPDLSRILEQLDTVAEKDRSLDALKPEMFVLTDAYRKMLDDRSVLVIGRKGSGKTAIRLGLQYFGQFSHDMWVSFDLTHFDPGSLERVLRAALGSAYTPSCHRLLENTWRFTIGCEMMRRALSHKLVLARDSKLQGLIESYLHQYRLTQEIKDDAPLQPDEVLDRVLRERPLPGDLYKRRTYPLDEEYQSVERRLMAALQAGRGAVVTVDDLDPSRERYNDVLVPAAEALIQAGQQLANDYVERADRTRHYLRVKCFVPQEMFTAMNERRWDKLTSSAEVIRWTHEGLRNLLARRLNLLSGAVDRLVKGDAVLEEKTIHAALGTSMAGYFGRDDTFTFLMFHTHLRPRDVLFLTRQIIQLAVDDDPDADCVDEGKFFQYLNTATNHYCQSILQEYRGQSPNLELDIDALHGAEARMPAADLRRKWADLRGTDDEGEWRKSLQGLYDAGVIGYAKGERHRSAIWTQRIVFSYSCPQAKVPTDAAVVIHPSFWSAYGVTPVSFRTLKP